MSKNKMLALLGGVAVIVLGTVAYLGSQGGDSEDISAPPTLEQSQSLTGSLSVADRWFTVDNSATSGSVSTDTTDSNFFIFTLGPDFQSNGIEDFKDNIVVSSGEEGFVLGTFEDNRWKLSPEKNYLGARLLQESELRACGTYFLIKIHHDADKSPKASFDFSDDFVSTVTNGSENCSADQLGMKENQWNLISTKLNGIDAFDALVDGFDEYKSVWDTFIINQAGDVNTEGTQAYAVGRNAANLKKFLKTDGGTDDLSSYFSSDPKQDMWVYVGDVKQAPVVENKVPTIASQEFNVDPKLAANGLNVGTLVASGGDGELEFSRLGGSEAFSVDADGRISIADISKLKLFNGMEVQVAERATPADKATGAASVKVNLEPAECKKAEEKVAVHIKEMEGRLSNGQSFEEAPYLLQPLSEKDKDFINVCAKFASETDVTNEILEKAVKLEQEIVAAGAQASTATESQASVSGVTEPINVNPGTVTQSGILPIEKPVLNGGGTQTGASIEDLGGNTGLTTGASNLSGLNPTETTQVASVSNQTNLVALDDCLSGPLGTIEWVDSSTKLSKAAAVFMESNKEYKPMAVVSMKGCDGLVKVDAYSQSTGLLARTSMVRGEAYEVSNQYVYAIDEGGIDSLGGGTVYLVLDNDGNITVMFGPDDQGYSPIAGFDTPAKELKISDGVFWYGDSDLNGNEYTR